MLRACCVLPLVSCLAPLAFAAPPVNDACASATVIAEGIHSGTLREATGDGAASVGLTGQPDVWYRFTALESGVLGVTSCGSNALAGAGGGIDTVLSLHSGCPGTTSNELAANDDWLVGDPFACTGESSLDSALSRPLVAGETVWIRVSRYSASAATEFRLRVSLGCGAPASADCATATELSGATGSHEAVFEVASGTPTRSTSCVSTVGNQAWFRITPAVSGRLFLSTCHPATRYDTVLQTFSGGDDNCEVMSLTACNDDTSLAACDNGCAARGSQVSVSVTAGQRYRVLVGSFNNNSAGCASLCLGLRWTLTALPAATPPNDLCANAVAVAPGDVLVGTLAGAGVDGSATVGSGLPDVWYRFDAPADGTLTLESCGSAARSGIDTVLSVHDDCPGTTGNEVGASDDSDGLCPDTVDAALVTGVGEGSPVWIRVSRAGGEVGEFAISVVFTALPATLTSVTPRFIGARGGDVIELTGTRFTTEHRVDVGGLDATDIERLSSTRLRCRTPSLPLGVHAVRVLRGRTTEATLADAVEVVPALVLTSLTPDEGSTLLATQVTVRGSGFRAETAFRVGSRPLGSIVRVSPTEVRGSVPALPPGESPGFRDLVASDGRGSVTLPSAFRYVAPGASPTVDTVTPSELSHLGASGVTIRGSGFTVGGTVRLVSPSYPAGGDEDGIVLQRVFVGANELRVDFPAELSFASGPSALVVDEPDAAGPVVVSGRFAFRGPLGISGITPASVERGTPLEITITGLAFRPTTRVAVAGALVEDVEFVHLRELRASVPGLPVGTYDVSVIDRPSFPDGPGPEMVATLPGALRVTRPVPRVTIPAPRGLEASLAEGTARIAWQNPVAYSAIEVHAEDGTLLSVLDGAATALELALPPGTDAFPLAVRGLSNAVASVDAQVIAAQLQCRTPPLVTGRAFTGDFILGVRGGATQRAVNPCSNEVLPDVQTPERSRRREGGVGVVVTERDRSAGDTSKLVTGFRLESPATALEIAPAYRKLEGAADLVLKARLIRVWPVHDFEDEFELIDPRVSLNDSVFDPRGDHAGVTSYLPVTYRRPCAEPIPAGEYLLEIFAEGGSEDVVYFAFAEDLRDEELLIPGVPCPPYPVVDVKDFTGIRALPTITRIESALESVRDGIDDTTFWSATLTLVGTWVDGNGVEFRISEVDDRDGDGTPDIDATFVPASHLAYEWTIHDGKKSVRESREPVIRLENIEPGCYDVDVKIVDNCGRTREYPLSVALFPDDARASVSGRVDFQFAPNDPGVFGVVGVRALAAAHAGRYFAGEHAVDFSVLALPPCLDGTRLPQNCAAPVWSGLVDANTDPTAPVFEIRIGWRRPGESNLRTRSIDDRLSVTDECPNEFSGAKLYRFRIDDLSSLDALDAADLPGGDPRAPVDVHFVGRTTRLSGATVSTPWETIGGPLRLLNPPAVLASAPHWEGYHDPRSEAYAFTIVPAEKGDAKGDFGDSAPLQFRFGENVRLPAYDNTSSSSFRQRFSMLHGEWIANVGSTRLAGELMGNRVDGMPLALEPTTSDGLVAGLGGLPEWSWCKDSNIFERDIEQSLFEAIIFAGAVGPVPVTITATVGFGLKALVEAHASASVRPFAADGGPWVESALALRSELSLSFPASVRADILFGLASLALSLIPRADFELDASICQQDFDFGCGCSEPGTEQLAGPLSLHVRATFALALRIKACLNLILASLCYTEEADIISEQNLIPPIGCRFDPPRCSGGEEARQGNVAGDLFEPIPYLELSAPASASSPDGERTIDLWVTEEGEGHVVFDSFDENRRLERGFHPIEAANQDHPLRDPAVVFVSNTRALIAFSVSYLRETRGLPEQHLWQSFAADPANANAIIEQDEIVVLPIDYLENKSIDPARAFRLIDFDPASGGAAPFDVRRPDGAVDLVAHPDPLREDAWAAWVRFETRSYFVPFGRGRRPALESTSVFARRITPAGVAGPAVRISDAGAGIDIEPKLAISPRGDRVACVWLHDALHTELIGSNRGRSIRMATLDIDAPGASWSAPRDVLPLVDMDARFPGALTPRLLLRDTDRGLLIFTALDGTASVRDTGLTGSSRFVYVSRLEGGAFGEPEKIHGVCQGRVFGFHPIWIAHGELRVDPSSIFPAPEALLAFQGSGPLGTRPSSGDIVVAGVGPSAIAPPITLTRDDRRHMNLAVSLAQGKLHSVHLDGGPASLSAGLGGIAGIDRESRYVLRDDPLLPDATITACRLTEQFPRPGSRVSVSLRVENHGLRGTLTSLAGESLLFARMVLVASDGGEREVATGDLPALLPGDAAEIELTVEMPHDPVLLRAELIGADLDHDASNNSRECFFGAPAPSDLVCASADASAASGERTARLRWTNPVAYEGLCLYRDGVLAAFLPGETSEWIDEHPGDGEHRYALRGKVGASTSQFASCVLDEMIEPPAEHFRRGDANTDGAVAISDAIRVFGYLFTGGAPLDCRDAADSNDDGRNDISDGIHILGFLFLGGETPRAPGPMVCGVDPSADGLGACVYPSCP